MGDVEMTNLRGVPSQPQPQHPRYQQLYPTSNGYRKDKSDPRRGKEDNQELIDHHPDDDYDEDDDVITVKNRRDIMQLREFRRPLEISTIGRQPQSSTMPSSMSSSHCSTGPTPAPMPSCVQPTVASETEEAFNHDPMIVDPDLTSPDTDLAARPSRSQVLHYFARAQNFTLRRVGMDMQITDAAGFPLFDAFMETDCCGRTWSLEAYGRPVLAMHEPMNSWCQDLARPRIAIRDWNGDFFGILLPGDPYYLHGNEDKTLAKMIPQRLTNGTSTIEDITPSPTVGAATVVPAALAARSSKSWLCVHEGTGRHIARLEDYQSIQYNKDVAFQLKLLTLAGIVRLCGQSQISPASNCMGVVKAFLNCCAGY